MQNFEVFTALGSAGTYWSWGRQVDPEVNPSAIQSSKDLGYINGQGKGIARFQEVSPVSLQLVRLQSEFMIIPYGSNIEMAEILHCFHASSNKLCLLSTPLGIYTQFRKTNALFMITISTAWLYTYKLNSNFAFFILFLPITTCFYKYLTNVH